MSWPGVQALLQLRRRGPQLQRGQQLSEAPLSLAQERLWVLEQVDPGRVSYNVHHLLCLRGALNREALEAGLKAVVARHEALRTQVVPSRQRVLQRPLPASSFGVAHFDLRRYGDAEPEGRARRIAYEAASRPFKLGEEPPLRAVLLRIDDETHWLLLVVHHIVYDGWSKDILCRELSAHYVSFARGEAPRVPELLAQYADFAVWQRQFLQGEVLSELTRYWTEQLRGRLHAGQLPKRPDPALSGRRAVATRTSSVPAALLQRLRALSSAEGVSLFVTLLAAYNLLLRGYTREDDLFVCSPVGSRAHRQLEPLIGYFVNILILRSDLSGNPSFRELLRRTQGMVAGAYAHQDLPMQLFGDLDLAPGSESRTLFALQNTPGYRLALPGVEVTEVDLDAGSADFDTFLSLEHDGDQLRMRLAYNTDLFDARAVEQALLSYRDLLEQVVARPDAPIASYGASAGAAPPRSTAASASPAPATKAQPAGGELLQQLSTARAAQRAHLLAEHLAAIASALKGDPAAPKLSPSRSLQELGMDSLKLFQFIAKVKSSVGVDVPISQELAIAPLNVIAEGLAARLMLEELLQSRAKNEFEDSETEVLLV
ncbi:condensation domain-containing protein [Sorangium sp. So ce429]